MSAETGLRGFPVTINKHPFSVCAPRSVSATEQSTGVCFLEQTVANRILTLSVSVRQKVLERDAFMCAYCDGIADSVDHIIPYAYCMDNDPDNGTLKISRLAKALFAKHAEIGSWRKIATDDYQDKINFATLSRFANSGGEWVPKSPDLRAALGLPRVLPSERKPRRKRASPPLHNWNGWVLK